MNIAALMKKEGEAGRANISQTTLQQVNECFETEERGQVDSGKKGLLAMYVVNRLKPEFLLIQMESNLMMNFSSGLKTY